MNDQPQSMITPDQVTLDLEKTAGLLGAELPDQRFVDASYLNWLYEENPRGRGIYGNVDESNDVRLAHYGLIPQQYRNAYGTAPFVFSLNAVSRSGAQRRGLFSEIGKAIWRRAQEQGAQMVVGVTNSNSTWPVKKQGWRVIGPMPITVLASSPIPARNVDSFTVTAHYLESSQIHEVIGGLDKSPAWNWTNCWTPEYLLWRLGMPHGCGYSLHVSPELFAVSTVTRVKGLPVAVVLKMLPREGRFGPMSGHDLVTAICHHHKVPMAVYAGHNRHVSLTGMRLVERFKPVPLNLVILSLSDQVPQDTFQLDTFEFFDMDAY